MASAPSPGGCNYVFVGNPGVGKSTILNSMVKSLKFKSGTNIGAGLTFKLQTERIGPDTFMDTPGLSCTSLRKKAAEAIKDALQMGGLFKVCFVVTLESGRVKPDDATTVRLVLEAAPEITKYALIINKVSGPIFSQLSDPTVLTTLLDSFFAEGKMTRTNLVHLNKHDDKLHDLTDVLADLPADLKRFLDGMPCVEIRKENVKDIKHDQYAAIREQHAEQIALMQSKLDEAIKNWKEAENKPRPSRKEDNDGGDEPPSKKPRRKPPGMFVFWHQDGEIFHIEQDLPSGTDVLKYDPGKEGLIPRKKAWITYNEDGTREFKAWQKNGTWCLDGIRSVRTRVIRDAEVGKSNRIIFPKGGELSLQLLG